MQESTVRQSDADVPSAKKTIAINGVSYNVIERFSVSSGEADIYRISDPEGRDLVLKYYRFNIKPKAEVMEVFRDHPPEKAIRVVDFGALPNGRYYEIQEFARYGDVARLLAGKTRPGADFAREFAGEMAACLSCIHSRNVIHRDIKPENILIREMAPLDLALTDFGISSLSEESLRQTTFAGTFRYIPPESVMRDAGGEGTSGDVTTKGGNEDIVTSKASDYWAMGLILLEMLTGRHPFAGIKNFNLLFSKIKEEPVPLDGAPDAFLTLLRGLLTKNPRKRWGAPQVAAWFAGDASVPVHFETAAELSPKKHDHKPFDIAGTACYTLAEAAKAAAANWDAAKEAVLSDRFAAWVSGELRDRVALAMVSPLVRDTAADNDDRLFEFVARAGTEPEFIYLGVRVTRDYLSAAALAVLAGSAAASERRILAKAVRGLWAKYFELAGASEDEAALATKIASEASALSTDEDAARVFLINTDGAWLREFIRSIRSRFESSILVVAPPGYSDPAAALEKAREIFADGKFTTAELLAFSNIPDSCFVARADIDSMRVGVIRNSEALATEHGADVPFLSELSGSPPEYTPEYYSKLKEYAAALEDPSKLLSMGIKRMAAKLAGDGPSAPDPVSPAVSPPSPASAGTGAVSDVKTGRPSSAGIPSDPQGRIRSENAPADPDRPQRKDNPDFYSYESGTAFDFHKEMGRSNTVYNAKRLFRVLWAIYAVYLLFGLVPPMELLDRFRVLPDLMGFYYGLKAQAALAVSRVVSQPAFYIASFAVLYVTRDFPESAMALFKGSAGAAFARAEKLLAAGRFTDAARAFEKTLTHSMSPMERQRVRVKLAESLFNAEEYERCVAVCRDILAIDVNSVEGHYYNGRSYLMLGDESDAAAKEYIYLFENKKHSDRRLLETLFDHYRRWKDISETAVEVYKKCYEMAPQKEAYRKTLCQALIATRDTSKYALGIYADNLKEEPGRRDLKILVATCYFTNGDFDMCLRFSEKIMSEGITELLILTNYAASAAKLNKKHELYDRFASLVRAYPNDKQLAEFFEQREASFLAARIVSAGADPVSAASGGVAGNPSSPASLGASMAGRSGPKTPSPSGGPSTGAPPAARPAAAVNICKNCAHMNLSTATVCEKCKEAL